MQDICTALTHCQHFAKALAEGDGEWCGGLFYNKKNNWHCSEVDGAIADPNRPLFIGAMDAFPAIKYCPWCGSRKD